jgi:hypothetical protein
MPSVNPETNDTELENHRGAPSKINRRIRRRYPAQNRVSSWGIADARKHHESFQNLSPGRGAAHTGRKAKVIAYQNGRGAVSAQEYSLGCKAQVADRKTRRAPDMQFPITSRI